MAQASPQSATAEGLDRGDHVSDINTDAKFLMIWWDGKSRIIGADWKEATAAMPDEEFKTELTLIASHVKRQKARGILEKR